ncbi:hypothetical protein RhiirC2_778823 [Rhizophagus irregularis]|uniref:Uncharacterized protein n=1 Tax=Rhizophagus irregularis TaxID=588596 RepID=A0A2N1NB74_9GLOM|nr:hypothetical protein RhiirC2_778823 [Rhizophagus irregularis]
MASPLHENIVSRLQNFFEVPNNNVVDDPPINVSGQPFHYVPYVPGGNEIKEAPDVSVSPDIAIVPRPATSTVIPRPPADTDVQYVEQLLLYFVYIGSEIAVGQSIGELKQKCRSWMQELYVRAVNDDDETLSPRNAKTTVGFWER